MRRLSSATLLFAASAFTAHAGLVALFNFDNPANTFEDSSGNGNHITGNAGTDPIWGAGTGFNGTGAFDFSGDRLIAPVDVNPTTMPQMTWGAWVRTDTLTSGLYKVLGHDNGAWDRTLGLDNRAPNGDFRFSAFTGNDPINASGPVEGTPGPLNTTDWAFIAAAHDQVGQTITFYIDLNALTTTDAVLSFTEPAGFGAGFNTFAIGGIRPDNANESWDGAIDNVFVYDEFLDLAAITAIRDAAIPEPSGFILTGLGGLLILLRRKRE